MIETEEPISLKDMEKVLKHLPEPTQVDIALYNFDHSNAHRQASDLYPGLDLKPLGYQSLEGRLENPSKEKILRIYKSSLGRTGTEIDRRFIVFRNAGWRLSKLNIKLDVFSVHVVCCDEIPDYIEKMREELKDTFVNYKIEQRRTLY